MNLLALSAALLVYFLSLCAGWRITKAPARWSEMDFAEQYLNGVFVPVGSALLAAGVALLIVTFGR